MVSGINQPSLKNVMFCFGGGKMKNAGILLWHVTKQ
jgi:hypothetical protein